MGRDSRITKKVGMTPMKTEQLITILMQYPGFTVTTKHYALNQGDNSRQYKRTPLDEMSINVDEEARTICIMA